MKHCNSCEKSKPFSEFYKSKATPKKYSNYCKICSREKNTKRRIENREYYLEKRRTYAKEYHHIAYKKHKELIQSDRGMALRRRLSNLVYSRLKRFISRGSNRICFWANEDYFEWNIEQLVTHLESLFKEGMNWENYGAASSTKRTWQLDHKKPYCCFNFNYKDHVKECWNLENLQPLWSSDNIKKGNKFNLHLDS